MRMLIPAAVALTLAVSPLALAQSTTSPSKTPTSPGGSMQPQWHSQQTGDMRASELMGTTVNNEAGEQIGEINEIVLSKDGKVAAVVIGVGGFLGMGEREVAVNFQSLRLKQDANDDPEVTISATKESLKAAPEWQWRDQGGGTSGTTGKGTSPAERPTSPAEKPAK